MTIMATCYAVAETVNFISALFLSLFSVFYESDSEFALCHRPETMAIMMTGLRGTLSDFLLLSLHSAIIQIDDVYYVGGSSLSSLDKGTYLPSYRFN